MPSRESLARRLLAASADSAPYLNRVTVQCAYRGHALHTNGALSTVLQVRLAYSGQSASHGRWHLLHSLLPQPSSHSPRTSQLFRCAQSFLSLPW